MEHPLISIVVPVYNTEEYLGKCLDTLVKQTYKNIEVIIVDDGSTDSSAEIADRYVQKHSGFHCFSKENGGLSSARNFGIEKSSGEYIGFIDSDDWVEPKMFEHLMTAIESNDADIAICDIRYLTPNGDELDSGYEIAGPNVLTSLEALEMLFRGEQYRFHAVNKLYKKSLFRDIRFPLGKVFEDVFTTYKTIMRSEKIALAPGKMYNYLKERPDSILTKPFSIKFFHIFEALTEIEQELEASGLNEKLEKSFKHLKVWTILDTANLITLKYRSSADRRKICKEYRQLSKKILSGIRVSDLSGLTKTQIAVIYLSVHCSFLFFPLYNIYLRFRRG